MNFFIKYPVPRLALGTHGLCRRTPVGQATPLLSVGRWVRTPVSLSGKQPGGVAWQMVGTASWDSSTFSITLVVSVGAVGSRVGPWLWQFSDGQPLVQGRLAAWHGHPLACMHFTPGRCIQHWVLVSGTDPAVTAGPMFLGAPCRRICWRRSTTARVLIYP